MPGKGHSTRSASFWVMLAAKIKQLRRWQRRLSRRVKGGKNRSKARMKVARLQMQVANARRDAHNCIMKMAGQG